MKLICIEGFDTIQRCGVASKVTEALNDAGHMAIECQMPVDNCRTLNIERNSITDPELLTAVNSVVRINKINQLESICRNKDVEYLVITGGSYHDFIFQAAKYYIEEMQKRVVIANDGTLDINDPPLDILKISAPKIYSWMLTTFKREFKNTFLGGCCESVETFVLSVEPSHVLSESNLYCEGCRMFTSLMTNKNLHHAIFNAIQEMPNQVDDTIRHMYSQFLFNVHLIDEFMQESNIVSNIVSTIIPVEASKKTAPIDVDTISNYCTIVSNVLPRLQLFSQHIRGFMSFMNFSKPYSMISLTIDTQIEKSIDLDIIWDSALMVDVLRKEFRDAIRDFTDAAINDIGKLLYGKQIPEIVNIVLYLNGTSNVKIIERKDNTDGKN